MTVRERRLAEARTTGSPLPGLVGFQADDGTPIYLTAWALGGGQYELKVSVGAPANSGDGVPIVTVS